MRAYRKKTPVSRREKRLVRVDMGLIAASIGVLAAGFGFNLAGTHAINLAVSVGSQIPDRSGLTEGASEPLAASAPCAFDERFYFDQQTASFRERFASAFGSPGNAAGKAAADANHMLPDLGEQAKRDAAVTRSTAPRLASLRPERLNTAEAPTGLSLRLDADSRTAIYDIAARTVYLPNGHRLEAHSGLGSHLDDPRYVTTKMQGPTPPNVYSLTLRERLFHGVRALRLTPTDDGKMFGRAGILAHSYMLGPTGQSNGCVSFRNYPAFLSAFLKGEVDRLVVVDHLATTTGKTSAASGG
jgi:hypothetical protein